jgi:tRNA threonylcarbamoyladenosine biosynthesis protein TsaB
MTLYLALDTATGRPTLALGTPADPGADIPLPGRRELSRDIERLAAGLLGARGARVQGLAGVVVADGPGSFTGLRIGIAFAKGVCRAVGVPLLAAPSLLGAARAAAPDGAAALVAFDALRGDVFRAAYRFGAGGVEVLLAPELARAEDPEPPGIAVRAGEAAASAAALIRLIGVAGGAEAVADPASWEPSYGRLAEAEARRLGRQAGERRP